MKVLGTEPGSSGRTASALNQRANFIALRNVNFKELTYVVLINQRRTISEALRAELLLTQQLVLAGNRLDKDQMVSVY